MVSDVLSEAVAEIDHYLTDDAFRGVYSGTIRDRIVALRNEADALRVSLDNHRTSRIVYTVTADCARPPRADWDVTGPLESLEDVVGVAMVNSGAIYSITSEAKALL